MVLSTRKVVVRLSCPLQAEIETKKSILDDENIFKSLCTVDLLKRLNISLVLQANEIHPVCDFHHPKHSRFTYRVHQSSTSGSMETSGCVYTVIRKWAVKWRNGARNPFSPSMAKATFDRHFDVTCQHGFKTFTEQTISKHSIRRLT